MPEIRAGHLHFGRGVDDFLGRSIARAVADAVPERDLNPKLHRITSAGTPVTAMDVIEHLLVAGRAQDWTIVDEVIEHQQAGNL